MNKETQPIDQANAAERGQQKIIREHEDTLAGIEVTGGHAA